MKAWKRASRLLSVQPTLDVRVLTTSTLDEELQPPAPEPGSHSVPTHQQRRPSPRLSSSPQSSFKFFLPVMIAVTVVIGILSSQLRETTTLLKAATAKNGGIISRQTVQTEQSSVSSSWSRSVTPFTTTRTISHATETKEVEEMQCTVWMAPSSLKGDFSGFGIYVTRDLVKGESILNAADGVGIPISSQVRQTDPNAHIAWKWRNWFGEYVWARGVPDHVAYESPPSTVDYQTGMGSLPNHHCILSYLDTVYPDPPYVDSLVNRFKDPSAGSFSYNRGREFVVQHDVKAGDEIFLNYGMCTPEVRQGGWTDQLLITQDFVQAATILSRARYHYRTTGNASSLAIRGGGNVVRGGELAFDPTTGAAVISPSINKHVASLLPKSRDEFQSMLMSQARETTTDETELVRQVALHSLHRRTPDWIRQNGLCLENLVGRPSTLPLAGYGAFAQRTIRAGEIVTPAPLLQIMDKEAFKIYDQEGNHVETQLLLNYCFGHPRSSLLLCPNTNAVLINHCSLRTKECGPKGPNAQVRWPSANSKWDTTTQKWLNMTIEEIAEQSGHGLAFEIVATRDIKPGDEVFIDYGVEWEQAWFKHVQHYQPPAPLDFTTTPWITAKEANDHIGPILDQFVSGDLRKTVEHPHLFTGCQYWGSSMDHHRLYKSPFPSWENMSDWQILSTFADSGDFYSSIQAQFQAQRRRRLLSSITPYSKHRDMTYWPCSILRPETPDGSFYTVRIHQPFFAPEQDWERNGVPRLLTNYSRHLIHYFVRPYHSDQHLPGVFRHAIGMDHEDMFFPEQWKNLEATD